MTAPEVEVELLSNLRQQSQKLKYGVFVFQISPVMC